MYPINVGAQTSIRQSGNVTPTHVACWTSTGVLQDCGAATSPYPTTFGVTNGSGTGICVNSDKTTAAGYQQACLGATTSGGAVLSVQKFGTAPTGGFQFLLNGATQVIPTVTLPVTNGDNVCFSGTNGTLIDCGGAFNGFANPTASVGLTAVNGSATTALRSDGAPALSQAIVPTWTAAHIFNPASGTAITVNPAATTQNVGLAITQSTSTNAAGLTSFDLNTLTVTGGANVTTGTALYPAYFSPFHIVVHAGGPNSKGAVWGQTIDVFYDTASTQNGDIIAFKTRCRATAINSGTGGCYGSNVASVVANGGSVQEMAGEEIDSALDTGGSATYRWGSSVVGNGNLRGGTWDAAFVLATAVDANNSWNNAFFLNNTTHGGSLAALSTTGCVICSDNSAQTIATFADLNAYTITGNIFNFANFRMTGAGIGTFNTHAGGSAAGSTLTLESTTGAGTTDKVVVKTASQATRATWISNGNLGLGTETNPQVALALSANTATGLSFAGSAQLGIVNADGNSTVFDIDTYSNGSATTNGNMIFRTARGTGAAPSNLSANDFIGLFGARPYTNGAFSAANTARISFVYTDTSPGTGTSIQFDGTPNGGARATAMTVQAGVAVGTSTDPGAGIVNVLTGFRIGNAAASGSLLVGNGTSFVAQAVSGAVSLTSGGVTALTSSAFANPANPGVNLTGANGSATTALRSDAILVLDQSIAPTWTAQHIHNVASTVASATGATLRDLYVQAATATITGNTGSPITAFDKVYVGRPTYTDSSAVTITDASTVYVDNAPLAAGSVTLTNTWALRVGAGNVKFPGTGNVLGTITSGIWNGTTIAVANGGTGAATFTSNGVLYGNGTSAIQVTAQGAANSILTANAGAPVFSATPTIGGVTKITSNVTSVTADANTMLQIIAPDAQAATEVEVRNYGGAGPTFRGYLAAGTAASPTAIAGGGSLWNLAGFGYGTSFLSTPDAKLIMASAETFSGTAHGTFIAFSTTPTTTVVLAEAVRIQASGGLSVGTTTDPGIGSLQLNAQIFMPNITTSSAAQTGTVCWTTGTGKFTVDTTVGCLTSIKAAKNVTGAVAPGDALRMVDAMEPVAFRYKPGWGDDGRYEQFGFVAEQIAAIDERMVGRDPSGVLQGVRYMEMTAILAGAIKEIKADNDNLRKEIETVKRRIAR